MRRRGNKAPLLARAALAVVSAVGTYLVADLLAGALLIRPLSVPMEIDPIVHHKMVPRTHTRIATGEFDYVHRVNNVGLRGADVELQKPPGVYRILMLGDSFTLGKGVEDHQTFSVLLQRSLERSGALPAVEVVNAGVDSYSPVVSWLQLATGLDRLEPDLVVLNLDPSDLRQEEAYRRRAVRGPDGEIVAVPGREPEEEDPEFPLARMGAVRRWIEQNLYFTRFFLVQIEDLRAPEEPTIRRTVTRWDRRLLVHTLTWDREDRTRQWSELFDSVLKIRRFCDDRGFRFLLTIYPWGHQVNDREWVPGRYRFLPERAPASDRSRNLIRGFAEANDIQLLDLFPAFRAYSGDELLYYSQDMHWTPAGHRLVAEELEKVVLESGPVTDR